MGKLTNTVKASIASFKSAGEANIESLKIHFLPQQEGSGDPSPENIRPITGWTGCNLKHLKKNIGRIYGYSASSITSPSSSRTLDNGYGTTINTKNYSLPDTALVITQSTYPMSNNTSDYRNGYACIGVEGLTFGQYYDVSFKVTDIIANPFNVSLYNFVICNPSGGQKWASKVIGNTVIFKNVKFEQNTSRPNMQQFDVRICGRSFTLSEFMVTPVNMNDGIFVPYEGETLPISWSSHGVEYGGYIDPVRGKLVAEYKKIMLKGKAWYRYTANQFCINTDKKKTSSNLLCDIMPVSNTNGYASYDKTIGFWSNGASYGNIIFIKYTDSDNLQDFVAWLNALEDNPYFVYEMETPIEYDLTPTQLQTFLGYNNFWSDTNDDTEVEYELLETKDIVEAKKRVLLAQPYLATANDTIAHFNTDMDLNLKGLKINLLPIQYGSNDPSPTNIRSITGWTSIKLNHSKKNMLKCDTFTNGTAADITYTKHTNENNIIDYITCVGTTSSTNAFRNLNYTTNVNKIPRGNVSVNSFSNQANIALLRPDNITDNNIRFYSSDDGAGTNASRTGWFNYNTDKFDEYMSWARIQIWPNAKNTEIDTIVYPMMCHRDDRGCEYEPYYGTITTISWENEYGTIYGGYIDLINGKLVQEWYKVKIKDCRVGLTSNTTTAWHNWYVSLPSEHPMTKDFANEVCPIVCDTFLATPQNGGSLSQSQTKPIVWASSVEGNLRFKYVDDCALTAEEFKTKYGEVEVAYKLATPIEYTLTPQQITAFKGTNNIWSDANGTVDIKYWTH